MKRVSGGNFQNADCAEKVRVYRFFCVSWKRISGAVIALLVLIFVSACSDSGGIGGSGGDTTAEGAAAPALCASGNCDESVDALVCGNFDPEKIESRAVLNGPVIGADVAVFDLDDSGLTDAVCRATTLDTPAVAGCFYLPVDCIDREKTYLISVTGGSVSSSFVPPESLPVSGLGGAVDGTFNAILSGQHILSGNTYVSAFSEVAYRQISSEQANSMAGADWLVGLDRFAEQRLLIDINGDARVDGQDVAEFKIPGDPASAYRFDELDSVVRDTESLLNVIADFYNDAR